MSISCFATQNICFKNNLYIPKKNLFAHAGHGMPVVLLFAKVLSNNFAITSPNKHVSLGKTYIF